MFFAVGHRTALVANRGPHSVQTKCSSSLAKLHYTSQPSYNQFLHCQVILRSCAQPRGWTYKFQEYA